MASWEQYNFYNAIACIFIIYIAFTDFGIIVL